MTSPLDDALDAPGALDPPDGLDVPDVLDVLVGRPAAGGGPMLRIGDRALDRDELVDAVAATAARLAGASLVAVWATTSVETCVGVLAALAAGVAAVPINPHSGRRELEHVVADSAPELLVVEPGAALPDVLAALPRVLPVPGAVTAGRPASGASAAPAAPLPPGAGDPERTALICYTSGTTGLPKGVQIPWRAVASNLDALAEIWAWTNADRLVHALPLYHVHGLVLGVLGAMRRGSPLELVPRFTPQAVHDAIVRDATMFFGVPTMYRRIADEIERDPSLAAAFAGLRLLVSGSAALPAAEHARLRRLIGRSVVERYGLTETVIDLGVRAGEPPQPGRVGRPLPGVEVALAADDGTLLGAAADDDATIGEVVVRGPNVFTGYLNRPDATAAAFRDGWFLTGDLATRDASGSIRIVGRRSTDLIKSGGYRIGAGEIESALLEHPAVAEAAVLGLADDDLGERVVAWVVLRDGHPAEPAELTGHVGTLLARHKVPREIRLVAELPRNGMGKVVKAQLRDLAQP